MVKELVIWLKKRFEGYVCESNGVEFWFARDLQQLLDYDEWRNFLTVLGKAKISCEKSVQAVADHFDEVNKTIDMPKGAKKEIPDFMLTRYACYLVAQNRDSRKEQIAFAG